MSEKSEPGKVEKKGLVKTLVGFAVAILVIWIFVVYVGATVPPIIGSAATGVADTGTALSQFGAAERVAATGARQAVGGARDFIIEVLVAVITIGFLIWAIGKIMSAFFGKKDAHPHP